MDRPDIPRRVSRTVRIGELTLGGAAPVRVQSMTSTRTADVAATCEQIDRLVAAGAELVRVAVPTPADTAALGEIVARSAVPIAADVHFHFDRALEAIAAGCAKIRLNPGNITDRDQVRRVIDAAGAAGVVIRVGVNEGSVVERKDSARHDAERARPVVDLMADKMAESFRSSRPASRSWCCRPRVTTPSPASRSTAYSLRGTTTRCIWA